MEFHGVDVRTQFKRMRELAPEAYRAFLEFDQKAFKDGALPGKIKELMALAIAQITQCVWCIQAHTKKAAAAGASDEEIAETTFVAMAMAAGAAWSHGGLVLQCLQEHRERSCQVVCKKRSGGCLVSAPLRPLAVDVFHSLGHLRQ
jgi:AhpD family alkylhydroperoxidase